MAEDDAERLEREREGAAVMPEREAMSLISPAGGGSALSELGDAADGDEPAPGAEATDPA